MSVSCGTGTAAVESEGAACRLEAVFLYGLHTFVHLWALAHVEPFWSHPTHATKGYRQWCGCPQPLAPLVSPGAGLGGQGDPVQGGVGVGLAQRVAGRLGHHHLARHMPPGGAGLAASRTPRALRPHSAHAAGLAWCPSTAGACGLGATGAFGGLGVLLRQSGPGLVLAPVVPNIRRPGGERDLHADVGRCARQKLRKGEWRRGNARAIGANWTKFTEIRTKFVRNSYEIRTNFVRISHLEKIHTNLFT